MGVLSYKTIKWLCIAVLAAALVPLLLLGFYAVPAADDFSYGAYAHLAYEQSGSILAAAGGAIDKTVESYWNWQGTFSAIFLMAMQPAVFSENLYALTPLVMLAALIVGTFVFCKAFFECLLGLEEHVGGVIASVLCLLSTQLLPSPVQGLYWFNGAVYYVFFHGLCLMACAVGIKILKQGGTGRSLLLCLLCFVVGGGNYVTALTATVLIICAAVILIIRKNSAWKRLVVPALVLLSAFALSIAAPGNAVRQAAQENPSGVIQAVLMSFESGVKYGLEWLTLPVAAALLLVAVISWPALCKSSFAFRAPLLVSLFSFCLFSAMFCPPIYAMGNVGDKRLLNMVYFAYILILAINLVYWLGWLLSRRDTDVKQEGVAILPLVLAAMLVLAGCAVSILQGTGFSSVGALSTLASGQAQEYRACAQRRFTLLKDESVRDVQLEEFPCKPYLLYFDDISEDPSDWHNEDMSTFYGKNSVVLR